MATPKSFPLVKESGKKSFNPLRRGGGMATSWESNYHEALGVMFQSSATRRGYGDLSQLKTSMRYPTMVSILCDEEGVWRPQSQYAQRPVSHGFQSSATRRGYGDTSNLTRRRSTDL